MTTQTVQQLALQIIHLDNIVLDLFEDDQYNNTVRQTYGVFNTDRTIFELYDSDTHSHIDTYKSLNRSEFHPVTYGKRGTTYGKYYGANTHTCIMFHDYSPDDFTLTLEDLDEIDFSYKLQIRYRKQKQDANTATDRWQQPILSKRHAMSAPYVWAAGNQPQYGMTDPESYLGRTQVHHITPDTGNDSHENLILLTDQQHSLMHTKPSNITFKVVAELVSMLRTEEPEKIYQLIKSSNELKKQLTDSLPSYEPKYYHRLHDYIYKRFMDIDNHKYNIWESIWDYETPEDKARINKLNDYQQLYYDLKTAQDLQNN